MTSSSSERCGGQGSSLPVLGVGVTYSPALGPLIESDPALVQVVEIEPQTLWIERADEGRFTVDPVRLAAIRDLPAAKILHGVGFPVGGSRPPDPVHVPPLLAMRDALNAPWISEHLAFNEAGGPGGTFPTGFLLPPYKTPAGVEAAIASIRSVSARLPVPFAIENGVSYLKPRPEEMADGAFLAAVAHGADCGIVLDLHNAWTNDRNGRQPLDEFLAHIPLDRVWEVHLAGGAEHDGYWLDAHSGAIPPALLHLAKDVIPALPQLRALIFEIMPASIAEVGLEAVRCQLELAHGLWARRRTTRTAAGALGRSPGPYSSPAVTAHTPADWEDALGALAIGRAGTGPLARELGADGGIGVFRHLIAEFRGSTVVGTLPYTSRLLLATLGEAGMNGLLAAYWEQNPPAPFGATEARRFAAFLDERQLPVAPLNEVLAFDVAVIDALTTGARTDVTFSQDPLPLLVGLADRRRPEVLYSPDRFVAEVRSEGISFRAAPW